jgi:hypothetical protein
MLGMLCLRGKGVKTAVIASISANGLLLPIITILLQ